MVLSAPTVLLRRALPLSAALLLSMTGCAAPGSAPGDGGTPLGDGQIVPDGGPLRPECSSTERCPAGFVCAAVEGVPRCVTDPNPPPPGDGTDCSPCPSPGECRMGVCIQPTTSGEWCEFDTECADVELCIAGRCTPDPRVPVPCSSSADCPIGLMCGPGGSCICTATTDCPIGLICLDSGLCGPGPGGETCVADAECPPETVCDGGRCRPATVCDIEHPDFTGRWNMQSILRIREALPSWLDGFLRTVDGPFRFLGGDAACFDFGLPDWVEMEVCELVRPYVEEYLPPWAFPVFRAIADLNAVLSEWHIQEDMNLTAGSATDSYRGTHVWRSIRMFYRGEPIDGTPESILDWRFSPSPFNASAVCGTFHIERHDVNVSIGSIIAWIVDTLVYEASDGRWRTVSEALSSLASGFCNAIGEAADRLVDYSGVGSAVRGVCTRTLTDLVDRAVREILNARIGASPITLRGSAPVTGPSSLRMGVWDGTLLGRGFSGSFEATR
jgi:hypothetical protein